MKHLMDLLQSVNLWKSVIFHLYFSLHLVQSVSSTGASTVGPFGSFTIGNREAWQVLPIYRFYGISGQYAKFQPWLSSSRGNPTMPQNDATLSFEFRTRYSTLFLMYLDDGIESFIALTLNRGSIQLRFKFGNSKNMFLRSGSNLNNDEWHKVKLRYGTYSITVSIDGYPTTGWVEERERATRFVPLTYTYIGGIPRTYRLQSLVLQSIRSGKNFIGRMRRFTMNEETLSYLEKYKVWIETSEQPCSSERNPCKNSGRCYVRRMRPFCDCSSTQHSGMVCDEMDEDAVAAFNGSEWLSYDLRRKPLSSFADEISLSFQTLEPNGLLLHTGKSEDYVILMLNDGLLLLNINLGSGANQVVVQPGKNLFNDGEWHTIKINRTLHQVDIAVDQANIYSSYLQDNHIQLTLDDVIYVGGSPKLNQLPGYEFVDNFVGCLKEVMYTNSDYRRLPISRMARNHDPGVTLHGKVVFVCSELLLNQPITFTNSESYLTVPPWKSGRQGAIEFSFKTIEQQGVLIYASSYSSDLFAIEVYSGSIFVAVNLGFGTSRFEVDSFVANGIWHHLKVERSGRNISISLNGSKKTFLIIGSNQNLDLSGNIHIGGSNYGTQFHLLAGLQSAALRRGFVGCLKNLRIDNDNIDLQSFAVAPNQPQGSNSEGVKLDCLSLQRSRCVSNPCKNNGVCKEEIGQFTCDCSNTSFTGNICEQATMRSSFNGSQFITFPLNTSIFTPGEELSLRFKTSISSGILFATTSNYSSNVLLVQLIKGGRLQLYVNFGEGSTNLVVGNKLNNYEWHSVSISRSGRMVHLQVDENRQEATLEGRLSQLEFDTIHLGMMVRSDAANYQHSAATNFPTSNPFVGQLENVMFNSRLMIESCSDQTLPCHNNSANDDGNYVISHVTSFQSHDSYVTLPSLQNHSSLNLFLSVKTTVRNGLLLYKGDGEGRYITLELMEGQVYVVCNFGNDEQVIFIPGRAVINDNRWHNILVTIDEDNNFLITVDKLSSYKNETKSNRTYNLNDSFYLGGVPRKSFNKIFPRRIASQKGYQGCIGNFAVNDRLLDLTGEVTLPSTGLVMNICNTPTNVCTTTSCLNGGTCIPEWSEYVCDCSLVTYIGEKCQTHWSTVTEDGSAFRFGPKNGFIFYKWTDSYPSPRSDMLTLGFSTFQSNTRLVKVLGSKVHNKQNFLELYIKNGLLTLKFNIGTNDVILSDERSVSDGQYHICVVRRDWMNATMRVDGRPELSIGQRRKSTVFSSQSVIVVGGSIDEQFLTQENTEQAEALLNMSSAFRGKMVGFFFNDVRVFDLAAEDDSKVRVVGDIDLLRGPIASHPAAAPTRTSMTITTVASFTTFTATRTTDNGSANYTVCDEAEECSNPSETYTGSASIKNTSEKPLLPPIAVRALISAGAGFGVLLLAFFVYRFRNRTLCCKNRKSDQRAVYTNGKHVIIGPSGNIISQNVVTRQGSSKEIYV